MDDNNRIINELRERYGKFPPRDIADLLNIAQQRETDNRIVLKHAADWKRERDELRVEVARLRGMLMEVGDLFNDEIGHYDSDGYCWACGFVRGPRHHDECVFGRIDALEHDAPTPADSTMTGGAYVPATGE